MKQATDAMDAARNHILQKYQVAPEAWVSSGMEAEVYAYGSDAVLKLYAGMSLRGLNMAKSTFSIAHKDEDMLALIQATDHTTLAVWAIDCAERVLPYFEETYPEDRRPRLAIEALQAWIRTGVFTMAGIRKASLDSHAAARDVGADNAARSAARAAGQAVATAHVPSHAYGSAVYAQQAIYRATNPAEADAAVARERDWQYTHLLQLRENNP